MVYRLMPPRLVIDTAIGTPLVGVDGFGIIGYMGLDERVQRSAVVSLFHFEADGSAALYSSENDGLPDHVPAADAFLLAADVRLVNLNDAGERNGKCFGHRCPDAMAEIPCGLIG